MKIWIDADAAPQDVKEMVFRAARRLQLDAVLAAGGNPTNPGDWRATIFESPAQP